MRFWQKIFKKLAPVLWFGLFFGLFNLMPIIPVEFSLGGGTWKDNTFCSLNWLFCIRPHWKNNFPQILDNPILAFVVFPFVLPIFCTYIVYRYFHLSRNKNLSEFKENEDIGQLYEKICNLGFPKISDPNLQIDLALLDGDIVGCVQTHIANQNLSKNKLDMLKNSLIELMKKFPVLENNNQKRYFKLLFKLGDCVIKVTSVENKYSNG